MWSVHQTQIKTKYSKWANVKTAWHSFLPTLHYRCIRRDIIKTYIIVSGKIKHVLHLTSIKKVCTCRHVQEEMMWNWKSLVLNTTNENLAFLTGWSIYEIVCSTGLFLLTLLTHSKLDWIKSGTIRIKAQLQGTGSCSIMLYEVYCKEVRWCGHRVSGLQLKTRSTSMTAAVTWWKESMRPVGIVWMWSVLWVDSRVTAKASGL